MKSLPEFIGEFSICMTDQLIDDFKRWGNTWRHRDIGNQADRIFNRMKDYYDQYKNGGIPIPWIKIACLALIAYVRENHPEELIEDKHES